MTKKTRPRGQRCVLGLKGDIDDERDRPTDGLIRHRDAGMHLKQIK